MNPGPDPVAIDRPAALVLGAVEELAIAIAAALAAAGFVATTRAPTRPADHGTDGGGGAVRAIAYLSASIVAADPDDGEHQGASGAGTERDEAGDVAAWATWLASRGGGRLVVVAPVTGLLGRGDERDAASAALAGAVRHAAVRWGAAGVTANLVAAGCPLTAADGIDDGARRRGAAPGRGGALRGRPVRVDEVASVVAFLCGASAGFVNGAVVPVDGGASMGFF